MLNEKRLVEMLEKMLEKTLFAVNTSEKNFL